MQLFFYIIHKHSVRCLFSASKIYALRQYGKKIPHSGLHSLSKKYVSPAQRAFKYIFGAGFPPQKYLCPDKCEAAQRLCTQAGRLGRALAVPTSALAELLSKKPDRAFSTDRIPHSGLFVMRERVIFLSFRGPRAGSRRICCGYPPGILSRHSSRTETASRRRVLRA